MKSKFFIFFLLFNCCWFPLSWGQESVLAEVYGDLDKDKIEEKVVVKELNEEGEFGKKRELSIFKRKGKQWNLMVTSKTAISESQAGGMMGDPFEEIIIKKGILVISHSGGSSWKWNTTEKYRYQNNQFELIGYNSFYGKLCEYWSDFDYNVSTGKIIYSKEYENCDEEGNQIMEKEEKEVFFNKLKKMPTIHKSDTQTKIISPKYKAELYF